MGMSKCCIIGNLGRDPEQRFTEAGLAICNFSVAASEKVKGEDKTQWFRVTAFGKLAEICGQYLQKGKQVYVEGRLQTNEWQDKNSGEKKFALEIIANQMQILGTKADNQQPGQSSSGGYQQPSQPQNQGNYQQQPQQPQYQQQGHNMQGVQQPQQQQQAYNENIPVPDNNDIPF